MSGLAQIGLYVLKMRVLGIVFEKRVAADWHEKVSICYARLLSPRKRERFASSQQSRVWALYGKAVLNDLSKACGSH